MKPLSELKREATESAEWRGHKIVWSAPYHSERTSVQNATCCDCGAEVQINTNPLPNGIDIGGTAVALNCPIEKE